MSIDIPYSSDSSGKHAHGPLSPPISPHAEMLIFTQLNSASKQEELPLCADCSDDSAPLSIDAEDKFNELSALNSENSTSVEEIKHGPSEEEIRLREYLRRGGKLLREAMDYFLYGDVLSAMNRVEKMIQLHEEVVHQPWIDEEPKF
jgi:hypothetical protein